MKIIAFFQILCYNIFKKAGNARRQLLAYQSFPHPQAQPNGEVDLEQIPMAQVTKAKFGIFPFVEEKR